MTPSAPAVFLSYASQDAVTAQAVADALRAEGVEVWFDRSELVGGDAWDAKIRGQISTCALFVPLISAQTQARLEGYFRLEWKLAAQRTHAMADEMAFLLPVVIDTTEEAQAKVPAEFRSVQWTRLPGNEISPAFCRRVKKLLAGETVAVAPAPGADKSAGGRHSPWRWIAPLFGMTMALVFALTRMQQASRSSAPPPAPPVIAASPALPAAGPRPTEIAAGIDPKSVAVLAFANLSDDRENEYFSDGISEELLNVLAKIPELKVSARTSAFSFKGQNLPIPEIARRLGVAYVVEGSVRRAGPRVRITAQLVKAVDGFHIWSDTFDRELKDIFGVQDEIAGLIAHGISPGLGLGPAAHRQIAPEAFQEYLAGRDDVERASTASLLKGAAHFRRAVEIDPGYAAAWVQLARTSVQLARWGGVPVAEGWDQARTAIRRAQELEPDSPDMLVTLGWVQRTAEWKWREAEQSFRRAMQLRPNHAETLGSAAVLLFNIGQTDEGLRLGKQATALDPLNAATHVDLAILFLFSDQLPEAESAIRRSLELAPNGQRQHGYLAFTLERLGRLDEAEREAALEPDEITRLTALAEVEVHRGRIPEARRILGRIEQIAQETPLLADVDVYIAEVRALLGDADAAFAALERARLKHDPSNAWLRSTDRLHRLYSDPRWQTLLRQVGLADDQLRNGSGR